MFLFLFRCSTDRTFISAGGRKAMTPVKDAATPRLLRPALVALLSTATACSGTFQYQPVRLARGEMTVRAGAIDTTVFIGGKEVASTLFGYSDLNDAVRCVPRAREHLGRASLDQGLGLALSGLTGILGLTTLILVAKQDSSSFATGTLTAVSLGGSMALRHRALGHSIDAMNYYNDSVGSLGATCAKRSYPSSLPMPQADAATRSSPVLPVRVIPKQQPQHQPRQEHSPIQLLPNRP
jgi:hypothetical protein